MRPVMPWSAKTAALVALSTILFLLPLPGAAAENPDQALRLLDRGELAAAAGEFRKAEEFWNQALKVRPGWDKARARLADLPRREAEYPQFIRNLERRRGAALRYVECTGLFNGGDYQKAGDCFAEVAAVLPENARAPLYLEESRRLHRKYSHGLLKVESNIPASILVDGKMVGETPLTLDDLPVGEHLVMARCRGAETNQLVNICPGCSVAVKFTFTESAVNP